MHEIGKLNRLNLGYVGENDSRVISIDVSEWLKRWPGATVYVQAVRPDGEKYIAATEIVDGVLTWEVAEEEVLVDGKGFVQFTALDLESGKEYKTRVIGTFIAESLEYFNKELEDDDPMQKWVNRIVKAAEAAKGSAGEAAESATKAEDSEKAAGESAEAAAASATQSAGSAKSAGESASAASASATQSAGSAKSAGESASAASASAMQASNSDKNAAESAGAAERSADEAEESAIKAKKSAEKAALEADTAADEVASVAAPPVVLSGEGKAVTLDGAAEGRRLVGLHVFGRSEQLAAPAPDAPVDVDSVTDTVVTLTGTDGAVQTLTVDGVTLRGVQVTGAADYTDADGTKWIADEVDFGRGKLVSRIGVRVFDGTESWTSYGVTTGTYRAWQGSYSKLTERVDRGAVMTHYPVLASYADLYYGRAVGAYAGGAGMDMGRIILCGDYATADELKAYLAAQHAAGTPLTVYYVLKEPVETAMTDEQLADFAALRVGADMTVSSGAWVRAEYAGDTKGYIDRAAAHVPEADHAADADTVRGVDVVSRVDAADADIATLKEDAAAIRDDASNALVRTASGHHVLIEDVSPIAHNLRVQVSSETVDDLTGIRLIRCGKNLCSDLVKGIGLNVTTGAEVSNAFYATSGYIPVSFGDDAVYVISGLPDNLYNLVAAYNADEVFVGRTSGGVYVKRVMDASSYTAGTPQGTGEIAYLRVTCYQVLDGQTIDDVDGAEIQLELGTEPTAYEPYVEPTEHTPGADGAVEGVRSVYPSTTLFTMTAGVSIECGYNRDINKGYADTVKDVRVDGVSVVADGVAMVPIASGDHYGVIKQSTGIGINSSGQPYLKAASEDNIKSRLSTLNALTPSNLDYAVKAAMCDGKGAAWTEDEQAAARERMSVENGSDFELIVDATLEEEANTFIVNFPKTVRECMYHIWFYNNNGATVTAQTYCFDKKNESQKYLLRHNAGIANDVGYVLNGYFRHNGSIVGKSIVGFCSDATAKVWTNDIHGNGGPSYMNYPNSAIIHEIAGINIALLDTGHVLNAGAVIRVWGR